jgi:hypothetical protein
MKDIYVLDNNKIRNIYLLKHVINENLSQRTCEDVFKPTTIQRTCFQNEHSTTN